MKNNGLATDSARRRGRPRKVESYGDWMARIDAEVDTIARKMERQPPTYAYLHPAQKKIVQILIEHMRSLPELTDGERCFDKKEYSHISMILKELFLAQYPIWEHTRRTPAGRLDIDEIPNGEGKTFKWILRNCASRAPIETAGAASSEDEEN